MRRGEAAVAARSREGGSCDLPCHAKARKHSWIAACGDTVEEEFVSHPVAHDGAAKDAEAMTESLKQGKRVMLDQVGLFADGAAVKQVGEHTFALAQQYVDEMIVVDNDAICAAIKDVFEDTRSILEPAGALATAGLD